jgi:hypothetical protein
LTVACSGACSANVSFRMVLTSFSILPYRKKNIYDSSRRDVVEITRVS